MKVGFLGLGRMGSAMARRLCEAGHDVAVYNRTPEKARALAEAGAKVVGSIAEAAHYGEAVFTMLADDAALEDVAERKDGLLQSLPTGRVHICAGTHGVQVIRKLNSAHARTGQVMVAAPMLGRPEAVSSGQAGIVVGGPEDDPGPLPAAVRRDRAARLRRGGRSGGGGRHQDRQQFRARLCHRGHGRRLLVGPQVRRGPASVLRRDDRRPVRRRPPTRSTARSSSKRPTRRSGQMAVLGLKDANLALAAGEAAGVPLPSANVWRDRLVGAVAHGDGGCDWAVMAREQARASGLA